MRTLCLLSRIAIPWFCCTVVDWAKWVKRGVNKNWVHTARCWMYYVNTMRFPLICSAHVLISHYLVWIGFSSITHTTLGSYITGKANGICTASFWYHWGLDLAAFIRSTVKSVGGEMVKLFPKCIVSDLYNSVHVQSVGSPNKFIVNIFYHRDHYKANILCKVCKLYKRLPPWYPQSISRFVTGIRTLAVLCPDW